MCIFVFFNDTATTEIYTYCHTLSLHDALPICAPRADQLIDDLVARVSIRIDEAHAVPVGRTLMEVTVDVCGLAEAEAVLADLAAAFEVPVVVDGEPYRVDLLWGAAMRSEERRVGEECLRTVSSRW